MLAVIGFIFIIVAIAGPLVKKYPGLLNSRILIKAPILLFVGMFISGLLLTATFYADPGHSYKVYYRFWSGSKVVTSSGYNLDWWGEKREFQTEIVFKYVLKDTLGNTPELPDNIYTLDAKGWEFADGVEAYFGTSVIIGINPYNTDNFSTMVDQTQSEDRLVHSRIISNVNNALVTTAKLMYAQEYISGEAANFNRYFKDQLENGMYVLETYDDLGEMEVIGDSAAKHKVMHGSSYKTTKRFKIKTINDIPVREQNTSLALYHMTVRQAVVEGVDWEPKFDKRLDDQKAQVAATQLEKQLAEKAIQRNKRLFESGEADKTEEKAKLEKDQIKQTITAETNAKVAFWKVQENQNLYDASIKAAMKVRVDADAKSYENRQFVSAGLTPQQKAQFENDRVIGVAAELAKMKLPEVYITNGDKNSEGLISSLLSAEIAKQMLLNKKSE